MKIENALPPNYLELTTKFPIHDTVIFAYGDTIYNPNSCAIGPDLLAHEGAHGRRQLDMGVEEWWKQYLDDPQFRFEEEVIAHAVEFSVLAAKVKDRNARNALRIRTANRIIHPLYAYKFTQMDALRALSKLGV